MVLWVSIKNQWTIEEPSCEAHWRKRLACGHASHLPPNSECFPPHTRQHARHSDLGPKCHALVMALGSGVVQAWVQILNLTWNLSQYPCKNRRPGLSRALCSLNISRSSYPPSVSTLSHPALNCSLVFHTVLCLLLEVCWEQRPHLRFLYASRRHWFLEGAWHMCVMDLDGEK